MGPKSRKNAFNSQLRSEDAFEAVFGPISSKLHQVSKPKSSVCFALLARPSRTASDIGNLAETAFRTVKTNTKRMSAESRDTSSSAKQRAKRARNAASNRSVFDAPREWQFRRGNRRTIDENRAKIGPSWPFRPPGAQNSATCASCHDRSRLEAPVEQANRAATMARSSQNEPHIPKLVALVKQFRYNNNN